MAEKITPQSEDFSRWYVDVVRHAGLADYSAVRGCMVIKPYGFAIWENIRDQLDRMIKETGHQNAYFPLFIPVSFFSKEAQHVEGFAKEAAVVTHYRLRLNPETGQIEPDPEAKLTEPLIVRPTSETIIWNTFKDWIHSWRDLPLKINQWANVVRWEMRPRLFLRTAEFLWQEGHTAHASAEEAMEEARLMWQVYETLMREYLAIAPYKGTKTPGERFAGAEETFTLEALMKDRRALQMGTSHFLGQNFAKAFDVTFTNKQGEREYVWATSWGVSTRLIGALIMSHGDDRGLKIPPRIAPIQVVIIPIFKSGSDEQKVLETARDIASQLKRAGIRVLLDDDNTKRPGWKFNEYELKGVPVRIALGPRDVENNVVEVARRDTLKKTQFALDGLAEKISELIEDIQKSMLEENRRWHKENTIPVSTIDELKEIIEQRKGFALAFWNGTPQDEEKLQEETGATIRCILPDDSEEGTCIITGQKTRQKVLIAMAY